MFKLGDFVKDLSKEAALVKYSCECGYKILYLFHGCFNFNDKQFLAAMEFVTNYDIREGVLLYSADDVSGRGDADILAVLG